VPVFANGNILTHGDIARCLLETGADAVMSAEGQLYNVALFIPSQTSSTSGGLHPPHADLALEYLDIVSSLRTPTPPSGIKGHLFKLLRPALSRETDLRNVLGELRGSDLTPYYEVVREMKGRMDKDAEAARRRGAEAEGAFQHWMAQPYVRPLLAPTKQVEGERATSTFGHRGVSNPHIRQLESRRSCSDGNAELDST
jgi:tRNA-dihydrouridine synthase 1